MQSSKAKCNMFDVPLFYLSLSGNPRRYQSRAVIKMCPLTGRRRDVCLETPVEDIETEGDRQLQVLLKRQLNTDVNLTE